MLVLLGDFDNNSDVSTLQGDYAFAVEEYPHQFVGSVQHGCIRLQL